MPIGAERSRNGDCPPRSSVGHALRRRPSFLRTNSVATQHKRSAHSCDTWRGGGLERGGVKACPHNGEAEGQYLLHDYPLVQVDFSQVRCVHTMSIGNPQPVEEFLGLWPDGSVRGSDVASTLASYRLQVSACG